MRRSFLVFSTLFLSSGCAKENRVTTANDLLTAKTCIQSWLDGVDTVITRTKDEDAIFYRDVLKNSAIAKPEIQDGTQVMRILSGVKNSDSPWIIMANTCVGSNLPSERNFIAEYDGPSNVLMMRQEYAPSIIVRGLIILHEMRHALQNHRNSELVGVAQEEDAYEYEFKLLDALNLPSYRGFIDEEVQRIRPQLKTADKIDANMDDPRIEVIFGQSMNAEGRMIGASILFMRSIFKIYDIDLSKEEATRMKQEFLTQYYKF